MDRRSFLGTIASGLVLSGFSLAGSVIAKPRTRFLYASESLVMTETALRDANGAFSLQQLPAPEPRCRVQLEGDTTPLARRMWKIALDDVERNRVIGESGRVYFGAGTRYGNMIYERDIAIAGVLGLNRFYPNEMRSSLKLTREVRKGLGYKVSAGHDILEIDAPWEVIAESDKEIVQKYKTNSYTRRTDDVAWLWTADDLFTVHPAVADWTWMLENGERFFKVFYDPWFDKSDGLFRGQPLYHDIGNSAYPAGLSKADCVLLKALSTNCLYYRGMLAMANACERCGRPAGEKQSWLDRATALKVAIKKEFTKSDGTLGYYKDRQGTIMPNREILGTAFAVIFGVVDGVAARAAYDGYPATDKGIPLFFPFIPGNSGPHNQASWPFCDTFFLWGKSIAYGEDYADYNAALLGRSLGTAIKSKETGEGKAWDAGFGSFHEKTILPSGLIDGSGHQLWSAAAYINVCIRAGLVS